jgi:hypothetical protein
MAAAVIACPPPRVYYPAGGANYPVYAGYGTHGFAGPVVSPQQLAQFPKVTIGQQLRISGAFGNNPGRLQLIVNGRLHNCPFSSWQGDAIIATVPDCGINTATFGQLNVLAANGAMIRQFELNVNPNPAAVPAAQTAASAPPQFKVEPIDPNAPPAVPAANAPVPQEAPPAGIPTAAAPTENGLPSDLPAGVPGSDASSGVSAKLSQEIPANNVTSNTPDVPSLSQKAVN